MQTKIGEVFDGVVSGATPNGFFVELDNTVEGFVSVNRLPEGHYEYDENRYALFGMGQVYKIGDRISIRVVSTDVVLRHVDFELADFHREYSSESEEIFSASEYRKNKSSKGSRGGNDHKGGRGNNSRSHSDHRDHHTKGKSKRRKFR